MKREKNMRKVTHDVPPIKKGIQWTGKKQTKAETNSRGYSKQGSVVGDSNERWPQEGGHFFDREGTAGKTRAQQNGSEKVAGGGGRTFKPAQGQK